MRRIPCYNFLLGPPYFERHIPSHSCPVSAACLLDRKTPLQVQPSTLIMKSKITLYLSIPLLSPDHALNALIPTRCGVTRTTLSAHCSVTAYMKASKMPTTKGRLRPKQCLNVSSLVLGLCSHFILIIQLTIFLTHDLHQLRGRLLPLRLVYAPFHPGETNDCQE